MDPSNLGDNSPVEKSVINWCVLVKWLLLIYLFDLVLLLGLWLMFSSGSMRLTLQITKMRLTSITSTESVYSR